LFFGKFSFDEFKNIAVQKFMHKKSSKAH